MFVNWFSAYFLFPLRGRKNAWAEKVSISKHLFCYLNDTEMSFHIPCRVQAAVAEASAARTTRHQSCFVLLLPSCLHRSPSSFFSICSLCSFPPFITLPPFYFPPFISFPLSSSSFFRPFILYSLCMSWFNRESASTLLWFLFTPFATFVSEGGVQTSGRGWRWRKVRNLQSSSRVSLSSWL